MMVRLRKSKTMPGNHETRKKAAGMHESSVSRTRTVYDDHCSHNRSGLDHLSPKSLVLLLVLLTTALLPEVAQGGGVYSQCGGHLKATQGIIQSPNFPGAFPVPLSCRWIIHAPANSKTVIYFTQYFLRHSFYITEYDYYASPKDFRNKILVGQIDAEDHFTTVVAYRPFVVLDLVVTDDSNVHLRVEEFLMDVHGFNISYHLVPQDTQLETVPCSVQKCSYLGHCLASADFSEFSCACFDGFHGKDCERGPYCDPDKGKNMCLNGGKCRYFYGSLVNACECPPGFHGPKCEEETNDSTKEECRRLKCSHLCEFSHETGLLHCACNKGFKLAEDGTTCEEEEHYRVMVRFPVDSKQPHLGENLSELTENRDSFANTASHILHLSNLSTARDFRFDNISESTIDVVFHLRKEELSSLDAALSNLIRDGHLFGVAVNARRAKTDIEPEMKLLTVESAGEGPALEGKLMTLVCSARGSDNLRFQWFKDGHPFNMSLTHRNAWEIRLPETIGEKQISVLNMDGVTTYDIGEFTCSISDFGQYMNQTVAMDVLPYPQVEVTPITVSAVQGSTQTFRCWSLDEIQRKFTYSWLKNGRALTDADDEIVEDLRPRGSRLLVRNALRSTNYTCCVTNKAGTSERSGHMFVVSENQSSMVCPNSALDGVKWNQTFGGFFNLQKCPTDAAESKNVHSTSTSDLIVRRLGDGYTSRRCNCNMTTGRCAWAKPNYARCQSVYLIEIYDMLMNIQLGYQSQSLMTVYQKLFEIACQARARMFAGDLDITAKNLHMVVTTATDFPDLAAGGFQVEALVKFLNILLEEAATVTQEEKQELLVGGRLVQMAEILQVLAAKHLVLLRDVQAATINLQISKMRPVPDRERKYMLTQLETGTNENHEDYADKRARAKRSVGQLTKSAYGNSGGPNAVLAVRYDRSILPLLDRGVRLSHPDEKFVSDVMSFVPMQREENLNEDRQFYLLDIPHSFTVMPTKRNKTYCFSWERLNRDSPTGTWNSDSCVVVLAEANRTSCLCPLPGHFTVVMMPTNLTADDDLASAPLRPVLITCVVSLACLTLALVTYLMAAKCLQQCKHMVHFNFILSLAVINLMCVLCLMYKETELLCMAGKIVLQFFTVSAFSFLLLDAFQLFMDIHARTHTRIAIGVVKFILFGWGVPVISVIGAVSVMEIFGYDDRCRLWCWWAPSHHHFYSVLIPVAVLVLGHTLVISLCVILMIHWQDEWKFTDRRKCLKDIGRGEFLLLLLLGFSVVATTLGSEPSQAKQFTVLGLNALLTLVTVLFLVVLKKPMRVAVISLCFPSQVPVEKSMFTDFRGNPSSHAELEAQKIHDYCETIDRERYTSEHKRQLRYLINSSSSTGGSYSAGAFSAPMGGTGGRGTSTRPPPALRNCDSASEAISFGGGGRKRSHNKLGGAPGQRVLRPEPSVSRLQDSFVGDSKYSGVDKGSSGSTSGVGGNVKHSPSSSSMPLPIVPMSLISRSQETLPPQRDAAPPPAASEGSSENHRHTSSIEKRRPRTRSRLALEEGKDSNQKKPDVPDIIVSSSKSERAKKDDALCGAPLLKKNLNEHDEKASAGANLNTTSSETGPTR